LDTALPSWWQVNLLVVAYSKPGHEKTQEIKYHNGPCDNLSHLDVKSIFLLGLTTLDARNMT
jgi:hypothetical protein